MVAAATNTWDMTPPDGPRRPSLEDVGGAVLVDETPAPDPATMLYADQQNQLQHQAAAAGKMMAIARISIAFAAGAPSVVAFQVPGNNVVLGTFTVTDNGVGDTSITWPANTFPPTGCRPEVSINYDPAAPPADAASAPMAGYITNGVRVVTRNHANAPADYDFTVAIN